MYFLGVVPPAFQAGAHFAVGEPQCHDADDQPVYLCFRMRDGTYEARHATVRAFKEDLKPC